jgi:hypothetical protein
MGLGSKGRNIETVRGMSRRKQDTGKSVNSKVKGGGGEGELRKLRGGGRGEGGGIRGKIVR